MAEPNINLGFQLKLFTIGNNPKVKSKIKFKDV